MCVRELGRCCITWSLGANRERRQVAGGGFPRHSNRFDDGEGRPGLQLMDERVERGARALGEYFHTTATRKVADMAAEVEASTDAGDEEAEANALHAAADGCAEPLGATGFEFHVRATRPARARCGEVRG